MDFDTSINPLDLVQFDAAPDATYATALESVAPSITQKIAEQQAGNESWTDTLQRVLPLLAATYQQKQILNIQLERAKAGLPPLDNSALGVGVSVGLTPEVKNMLIIGGIGLGVILFMSRSRR